MKLFEDLSKKELIEILEDLAMDDVICCDVCGKGNAKPIGVSTHNATGIELICESCGEKENAPPTKEDMDDARGDMILDEELDK